MVVRVLILSLFMVSLNASASAVIDAFKAKNYRAVSDYYRDHMRKNFSRKELVVISYSLRKLGFFRQDIRLNARLIKKHYLKEHKKLMAQIKRGDTVDSDDYPKSLSVLYWNLFTSYGQILKGYGQDSALVEKDNKSFTLYSKILSELEFRESKVDKYNDSIIAHRQYLKDKIYRFSSSLYLQYVSWQQEATISHPTAGEAKLVLTNKGLCPGGDIGMENYRFHFYVDGCFLIGGGNVKNLDQSIIDDYQQSNVPAYGLKIGPGASVIVSSSKSRIGIKLPIIYNVQKLENPPQDGYKIEESSPVSVMASLYSRWDFDWWHFQTEFGKYIQQEATFWGLGVGINFK